MKKENIVQIMKYIMIIGITILMTLLFSCKKEEYQVECSSKYIKLTWSYTFNNYKEAKEYKYKTENEPLSTLDTNDWITPIKIYNDCQCEIK